VSCTVTLTTSDSGLVLNTVLIINDVIINACTGIAAEQAALVWACAAKK